MEEFAVPAREIGERSDISSCLLQSVSRTCSGMCVSGFTGNRFCMGGVGGGLYILRMPAARKIHWGEGGGGDNTACRGDLIGYRYPFTIDDDRRKTGWCRIGIYSLGVLCEFVCTGNGDGHEVRHSGDGSSRGNVDWPSSYPLALFTGYRKMFWQQICR